MDQLNQNERRGMFGGLRVPFDLNMLVLSFICVVGFKALIALTEAVTNETGILRKVYERFFDAGAYAAEPHQLSLGLWFLVALIGLGYWTFFSTAISRIAAMKLAREETLELKEAARFASRKFLHVLASVLFVGTIFLMFYVVCNATIAGVVLMRWPVLDVIMSVLFFTVLLSTFFVVFSLVLGLFGFNLAAAAIATESSDTWDGISRAWNYILVRPWHVLLVYGLTGAYLAVFLGFSTLFLHWSVDSLTVGQWGAGEHAKIVSEPRAGLPDHLRNLVAESAAEGEFLIPGKVDYFRHYLGFADDGIEYTWESVPFTPSDAEQKYLKENTTPEKLSDVRNPQGRLNVAAVVPGTWKLSASIIWFWLWVARFVIAAYALQYFFSSTTTLYFLLRKEVEDEDYGEIVVEEEELEDEAAWEVKEPAKPGATAPAGGLIMPASGGASAGLKPLPMMGTTSAPANAGHSHAAPAAAPAASTPPAASAPPASGETKS
jgi:hypothetical protein